MTSSRVRRLVIVVGVLIALPSVLMIVATALVPKDKLAAEIAAQVTAATGAGIEPGHVALKVIGGLGLTLADGLVQGTVAGPDLGAYELDYSRLEISMGLWPLLRGQVVVKTVTLQGASVLVEVGGDTIRLRNYDVQVTDLHLDLSAVPAVGGAAPGEQIPSALSFRFRAQADELVQQVTPWQEVRLVGTWAERSFRIAELTAGLGEGQLTADGNLNYAADPWGLLTWEVRLKDIPAGILLTPYLPALGSRLDCKLTGDVSGSMGLRDPVVRQRTLALTGEVTAGDGVLRAEDWLQDVSRYLGQRQDLKTVHFSRLTHRFEVAEGRYLVKNLEIDGHETDWQAAGWLGFDGGIGLNVGVRLPVGFTPDLGAMSFLAETMRDDEGRVRLGLKLSGQAEAPNIGLDLAGLGRRR